jgi:hypothetical protein
MILAMVIGLARFLGPVTLDTILLKIPILLPIPIFIPGINGNISPASTIWLGLGFSLPS